MGQHDILIVDLTRMGSDDLHWHASGSCDGREFEAKSILYKGSPIFKIEGAGSLSEGSWSRGERSAVARACKNKMLVETGQLPVAPPKSRAPYKKSGKPRRVPGVKYHHSGWPMNSSISALKRSR